MTKVKINDTEYPAIISGTTNDARWENREAKSILIAMDYATAINLFVNDVQWFIVSEETTLDENGEPVVTREEYDNSEFCIAGDLTDHRNGTLTIKMGKPTDLEDALELLLG